MRFGAYWFHRSVIFCRFNAFIVQSFILSQHFLQALKKAFKILFDAFWFIWLNIKWMQFGLNLKLYWSFCKSLYSQKISTWKLSKSSLWLFFSFRSKKCKHFQLLKLFFKPKLMFVFILKTIFKVSSNFSFPNPLKSTYHNSQ